MQFTTANFDAEVLKSDIPVLVDFYADWCGPCKMLSPAVEAMEPVYAGKVKIGKLNVDDNPEIAEKYNVMSIPTLIFFRNGQVQDTSVGLISRGELKKRLDQFA